MKRALLATAALALAVVSLAPKAEAADIWQATLVPGADAGSKAAITSQTWLPGNQFMVSCTGYGGVTYRVCKTSTCAAVTTDAPVETGKQIDLCAPTAYTALSLFKTYDGGNPSCNVFLVQPKTVCQTP